jgi:phosphoglycerol transferase MdoB-like AlkP superfamily enzyme
LADAWRSLIRRISALAAIFLALQFVVRATLALRTGSDFVDAPLDVIRPFFLGFWFDLIVLAGAAVPIVIYWLVLPKNWRGGRFDVVASFAAFALMVFIIGFTAIAEHLFWGEFGARFNFIAVDYLIYTQEVIGNVRESYPIVTLFIALIAAVSILTWTLRRYIRPARDGLTIHVRAPVAAILLACSTVLIAVTDLSWTEWSTDALANELSANGYYTLLHAARHNEINFARFYYNDREEAVAKRMREIIGLGTAQISNSDAHDITHDVIYSKPPLLKNVVIVTMESMGAEFMGAFGSEDHLTPNLDHIADGGLLFTHLLATGTRTVRGLEAITLSLPPTPGQSILRRPHNDNLFSLGAVLRDRGYDTAFIYGGFGMFDDMNSFFAGNGYRIVDRTSMNNSEIHFTNIWGVCDEDLFARVVHEADAVHARGQPFLFQIMTTSNHRPYTFPKGRIDIPPGTGRPGAVKYADYAVGKLMEEASKTAWFKDTLFVFVADHTAGAAGKMELDPAHYHIPTIFYAPAFVQAGKIDQLASQMDIAPSILGLLNISYRSRFLGHDQINNPHPEGRAFISNYQKVAMLRNGEMVVLGPRRDITFYRGGRAEAAVDRELLRDTVTYYQFASRWSERFRRVETRINGAETAGPRNVRRP